MSRLINGSAKLRRWSLDLCISIRVRARNEKTKIFGITSAGNRADQLY
jgi:hypothetical protein